MKAGAEAASRGTTGRRQAVPVPEATGDREEARESTNATWPTRAGNQAVGQFVRARAGHTLPPMARAILERQLGDSLDNVRVHTDEESATLAERLDARAFTIGRHIVFGAGEYRPHTEAGLRLLAHELSHVAQQRGGVEGERVPRLVPPTHASEQESAGVARSLDVRAGQRLGPARRGGGAPGRPTPGRHRAGAAIPLRSRVSHVAGPAIQRQPRGTSPIAEFDVGNEFTLRALLDYLDALDQRGTIEDRSDSDDKARAIVKQWVEGGSPFVVSARRAMLMIKEMQDGFTGDDDERAILELLWRSGNDDLREIFGTGGVDVDDLNSDFHTEEWGWLKRFYDERMPGARQRPPRINPVGEPVALGTPIPVYAPRPARAQPRPADQDPSQPQGDIMHPERCATYEEWISFFLALPTYPSPLGPDVIGPPAPAPTATATDLGAPEASRRPPVREPRERYLPTDRFIDGPTEAWVRANLPANLVATAYQLPSDCADIAVILRHVWLAAHNREEMYRGWLCGSRLGDPRTRDISALILNEVYSGNVAGIVSSYSDARGNRLLTFGALEPLLHPGDIMVWSHPGGGGHTHTVTSVERDPQGRITQLVGLQGNQPISEDDARRLVREDRAAQRRRAPAARQATPTEEQLRAAPGRRIERDSVPFRLAQRQPDRVWDWGEGTRLVAAGPPAAAPRPRPPRGRNRALTDWRPGIAAATLGNLDSTFESALLEVRTFLEQGTPPTANEANALAQAAGDRLLALARDAGDVQEGGTHYARLQRMAAQIRSYGAHVNRNNQPALWTGMESTFVDAARGISTVDFTRAPAAGMRQVDVLVSGFDPFNADIRQPPRAGDWNPSAAAARALDGATLPVDARSRAAVEGVVFPVSFREFRGGIVERVIDAHPNVNAVLTVSLDASLDPNGPVDLEQYAVGVHRLYSGQRERIPAAPGGQAGPQVEEATYALDQVAQDVGEGGTPRDTHAQRPTVDFTLTLEFADATTADRALAALGEPPQRSDTVEISSQSAVRTIVRTMRREIGAEGMRVTFAAGGYTFGAEIVAGPGGDFLSNEVSYRALRRLQERAQGGVGAGTSFHVHTPGAVQGNSEALPPAGTTVRERQQRTDAERQARTVLTRLVSTLKRVIVAVARRIVNPPGAPRP